MNWAGFRKYYGDRLTNISDDTSDEEIRQVYDHWARDYDKVIKMYQIISPQTILDQQGFFHHPPHPQHCLSRGEGYNLMFLIF